MRDAWVNQAAGLHLLRERPATRFAAMASHGHRISELQFLCDLCGAWSDFGYCVAVLDATTCETDDNPGLLQLLQSGDTLPQVQSGQTSSWPIVSAALGLEHLRLAPPRHVGGGDSLKHLSTLLENFEIVLIYARAADLVASLPDSGIEPLLPVCARGMPVLSAYHSLKQLLIIGKLQPTIVAVMDESDQTGMVASRSIGKSLQDCVRSFLSLHVDSIAVFSGQGNGHQPDDMHRLALRVLERAAAPCPSRIFSTTVGHVPVENTCEFARSH